MASKSNTLAFLSSVLLVFLFFPSAFSQTCKTHGFSSNNNQFTTCNDLPGLNSFLHWNYNPKTGVADIAYRQPMPLSTPSSSRWISWAINPTSRGMRGAQALVAFRGSDGVMQAYTSSITSYRTRLERGNISFPVPQISAAFENNEMVIFATIELSNNNTMINHLWQEGPLFGDTPGIHALSGPNVETIGTLDLSSGIAAATPSASGNSKQLKKNIHGVLCTVSWGTLMPAGVMLARYVKVFKSGPAWFYAHILCQFLAYGLGVAGWGLGLKLGAESSGIQYTIHRNLGISAFSLATLQVFALFLRPKPDHKYRLYWTVYHQVAGLSVITLSVINVFKGFEILEPPKIWKIIYIGLLVVMGVLAVILETFRWREKAEDHKEVKQDTQTNIV